MTLPSQKIHTSVRGGKERKKRTLNNLAIGDVLWLYQDFCSQPEGTVVDEMEGAAKCFYSSRIYDTTWVLAFTSPPHPRIHPGTLLFFVLFRHRALLLTERHFHACAPALLSIQFWSELL